MPRFYGASDKSQGSEFPFVVISVTMQHFMMLRRNLIYTGVTRGRIPVVLVGQKKAPAFAVKGKQSLTRKTDLCARPAALARTDSEQLALTRRVAPD